MARSIVCRDAPPNPVDISPAHFTEMLSRDWPVRIALPTLVTLAAALAIVTAYVLNEHDFYTSDYFGYQSMTESIVVLFRQSPLAAVKAIAGSINSEYTTIFTIPLVPLVLVFGDSRVVYEIGLTLAYTVPLAGLTGAVATRLIRAPAVPVFWSTVGLTLLFPTAWVPTLRGYPDAGATCLILLALWMYLGDVRLRSLRVCFALGILFASAMLFRRHYAYELPAFLVTALLPTVFSLVIRRDSPRRERVVVAARVALVAVSALGTLVVLGLPFLRRAVTIDYASLYSAYMQPTGPVVAWYATAFGFLAVCAALLGFVLGFRHGIVRTAPTLFVVAFGIVLFLEWALVVRQTGEQYTLHFTAFVILGLAGLFWSWNRVSSGAWHRYLGVGAFSLGVALNMFVGLAPANLLGDQLRSPALAINEPPLSRDDRAAVADVVAALRNVAGGGEPIYVAASSGVMNRDLFASAERALYGWDNARLNLLYAPQIDSRDAWPLEMLMQADFVVLGLPFQHHLAPESQQVVKVVTDLFVQNQSFARDFVRLPDQLMLSQGTSVTIYRRINRTGEDTALQTLAFLEASLPRPGGQPAWIVLQQPVAVSDRVDEGGDLSIQVSIARPEADAYTAVVYLGPLLNGGVVGGTLAASGQTCGGTTIRMASIEAQGQSRALGATRLGADAPANFGISFLTGAAKHLLVEFAPENNATGAASCPIHLSHLRVQSD